MQDQLDHTEQGLIFDLTSQNFLSKNKIDYLNNLIPYIQTKNPHPRFHIPYS